jgi:hypothetical protein
MSPLRLALLLAFLAGPAMAEDGLKDLLATIAPDQAPQGSVDVQGRIETGPDGAELVVSLLPKGAAKLVADPGITVTPLPATPDGVAPGAPVELIDPSVEYLTEPPELHVPVAAGPGPLEARVDYAYCLVDYQCLFGETTLRIERPAAGCGPDSAAC